MLNLKYIEITAIFLHLLLTIGLKTLTNGLAADLSEGDDSRKLIFQSTHSEGQHTAQLEPGVAVAINRAGQTGSSGQEQEKITTVKIKVQQFNRYDALKAIKNHNYIFSAKFPRQSTKQIIFKKRMTTMVLNEVKGQKGELIQAAGYDWDEHQVKTEDGYYLTLFRIKTPCDTLEKGSIFFQHGLLGSSSEWLLGNLENSLPLRVASIYGDVWLGNSRGNEYSMRHETLSNKSPEYWDFSFDEMGRYDLKAVFDYILGLKGEQGSVRQGDKPSNNTSKIYFVGNGLGNAMFYIFMSQNQKKYEKHFDSMIAIAPTALISHMTSPVKALAPFTKIYETLKQNGPLLPSALTSFMHFAIPELCPLKKHGQSLCSAALFFTLGQSSIDENATTIENIYRHLPSTTSIKTLVHYLQLTQIDEFRNFDYGPIKNFDKYNQTVPQKYNLFLINVSSLNIYGENDVLLDRGDVEKTISDLGPGVEKLNIQFMDHQSTDFLYGDVAPLVIKPNVQGFFSYFDTNGEKLNRDEVPCECSCNDPPKAPPPKTSSFYLS